MITACGGDDDGGIDLDQCSSSPDTCDGDTVCIAGSCEAAFGRLYRITAVQVQLPTLDPNGEAWDVGGGAPDIFIDILVNGASVARSAPVADRFSATFAGPFTVQPIGGGSLAIVVYDEDLTTDDVAYSCTAAPLTTDLLRARELACDSANGQLSFRIDPS